MSFIDDASLTYLLRFVREASGVELTPEKAYLAEYRLRPIATEENMGDLQQLCRRLADPKEAPLRQKVLDAMTTHETLFFRDPLVFARIKKILQSWVAERSGASRRLRIWSAACSTGQEAYSMAMLLRETIPDISFWDIKILGTDIAAEPLKAAEDGVYAQLHVNRGLPTNYLMKYFTQEAKGWQVSGDLKRLVEFRKASLLELPPQGGPFDLVLCRNVMIYFNADTSRQVLARLREALHAGGYLILGGSENLQNRETGFSAGLDGQPCVYKAV